MRDMASRVLEDPPGKTSSGLRIDTGPLPSGDELSDGCSLPPGVLDAAPLTESVLKLSGISKRWRRGRGRVLNDIYLDLPAASIIGVGGRNGAGKTTLLRVAAGLITPDSGQVCAQELDPERDRRAYQSQVGFLSTGSTGLYARMSVCQHLRYQSRLDLLPRSVGEHVIEREFERLHLSEIETRRVDRLSMGQRQRLRLAMVMLRDPTVLLLDEPDNSLDEHGISMLLDVVADVAGRGGVVIWCSPMGGPPGLALDRSLVVENGGLLTV
jgi:ABC-type multidrug transport system ATPase subunit